MCNRVGDYMPLHACIEICLKRKSEELDKKGEYKGSYSGWTEGSLGR